MELSVSVLVVLDAGVEAEAEDSLREDAPRKDGVLRESTDVEEPDEASSARCRDARRRRGASSMFLDLSRAFSECSARVTTEPSTTSPSMEDV